LLRKSVEIAREARDIYCNRFTKGYWDSTENGSNAKGPILVAASVGGYGAYLADGSEYRCVMHSVLTQFILLLLAVNSSLSSEKIMNIT